jgi:hypothetical protein
MFPKILCFLFGHKLWTKVTGKLPERNQVCPRCTTSINWGR